MIRLPRPWQGVGAAGRDPGVMGRREPWPGLQTLATAGSESLML